MAGSRRFSRRARRPGRFWPRWRPRVPALSRRSGTQSADTLAGSSGRQPPAAQFYATDDQAAGATVADLIRAAGYAPVLVGGIGQSIRIEAFGDLHETTLGAAVTEDEARKLI